MLKTLIVFLFLSLTIVVCRLHTLHEPFERDILKAAVQGHELLYGKILYADMWASKPPALQYTFVLAEYIFGYGDIAIFAIGIAFALITLFAVYWAASIQPFGRSAGILAALFWTLVCSDLKLQANQPNCEAFINTWLTLSFGIVIRIISDMVNAKDNVVYKPDYRWLLAGFFIAFATLYKQVAFIDFFFFGGLHIILYYHFRCGFRSSSVFQKVKALAPAILPVIAGGLVFVTIFAIIIALFWHSGHLDALYENATFASYYAGNYIKNLARTIFPISNFIPVFLAPLLPLAFLSFVGIVLVLRSFENKCEQLLKSPWFYWCIWAMAAQIRVSMPGKFFPHYYQFLIPVFVIGGAWGIIELFKWKKIPAIIVALCIILGIFYYEQRWFHLSAQESSIVKYDGDIIFVKVKEAGKEAGQLLQENEKLFQFSNEPGFFYYSRTRLSSKYFWIDLLIDKRHPLKDKMLDSILQDLEKEPPELFIDQVNFAVNERDHIIRRWFFDRYRPLEGNEKRYPFAFYVRRGGRLDKVL